MIDTLELVTKSAPGILFIFFGSWWFILIASWSSIRQRLLLRKSFDEGDKTWKKLLKSGKLDRCALPLPCRIFIVISIEGILKLVVSVTGIIISLNSGGKSALSIQTATVFLFVGLSGFSDIISSFDATPLGFDYFTLALAYSVEAYTFFSLKASGETFQDFSRYVQAFLASLCLLATVFEMNNRKNFSLKTIRSFFTIVQGFWFFFTNVVNYSDYFSWLMEDEENLLMWLSISLSWTCGVVFFYSITLYVFWFILSRMCWCCRVASLTRETRNGNSNIYRRTLSDNYSDEERVHLN